MSQAESTQNDNDETIARQHKAIIRQHKAIARQQQVVVWKAQ